jgi:hypothetical protein
MNKILSIHFLKSKLVWALILFLSVFIVYFLPVQDIWFSIDDCGNIVAGIIRSFKDLLRIFWEDERNYLYPINFNVPKANFISVFYRPMQHIPFSIIYYIFGFNAKAFYFVNILFHAINTVLFLYLTSYFIPMFFSVLAAFLFAFYPVMDWLVWISTLHNLLATFFMFMSLILFKKFWLTNKYYLNYLAAFCFLFSIVSRENTVVLGTWLFLATFVFINSKSFAERIKFSLYKTFPFLTVYIVYFMIRFFAFGYQTLPRTLNNVYLRIPVLKNIVAKL